MGAFLRWQLGDRLRGLLGEVCAGVLAQVHVRDRNEVREVEWIGANFALDLRKLVSRRVELRGTGLVRRAS
jgi:hypothetical protein